MNTTKQPGPLVVSLSNQLGLVERLRQRGSDLRAHPVANGTIDCTEQAGELLIEAATALEQVHTFLNAAAGEGFVLDGVDAADLCVALFPERYAAAIATIGA